MRRLRGLNYLRRLYVSDILRNSRIAGGLDHQRGDAVRRQRIEWAEPRIAGGVRCLDLAAGLYGKGLANFPILVPDDLASKVREFEFSVALSIIHQRRPANCVPMQSHPPVSVLL